MDVILRTDFPSLGYVGDKVSVKPGYARNFLIPKGIALDASSRNKKMLAHLLSGINARKIRLKSQADEVKNSLEQISLEFKLKVGETGKAFGSVNVKDILAQLKENSFALERKQIRLLEPLKNVGEFKILVKLHSEVEASVPITILADKTSVKKASKKKVSKKKSESTETEEEAPIEKDNEQTEAK